MESNVTEVGVVSQQIPLKFTKTDIYEMIRSAPETLSYIENSSPQAKSEIWRKFKIVCVNGQPVDYVKCNDCITVYQWTSVLGTGTMLKHKCKIPVPRFTAQAPSGSGSATQMSITQMLPKKAPSSAIDQLNDTIVMGLAKDLKPLETVKADGFKMYAQALITFGAKYGNQKIKDVIKSSTTLRENHLKRLANDERSTLKDFLTKAPSCPYYAFTFDLWTETKTQRHFISLTAHFIDAQFQLQTKLLGAQEFPSALRKTTTNIRDQCSSLLQLYINQDMIPTVLEQSVAVTDGGSNVIGVFETRYPCMCHKLNLILEHTFSEKTLADHMEIKSVLAKVKAIVTYFKHSGQNANLKDSKNPTMKQTTPTRWNSHFIMLEAYRRSSTKVHEILLAQKQLHRLVGLKEELVDELISLLNPFLEASNCFSAEKSITIDKVARKHTTLQKHLQDKDGDSQEIKAIKVPMRELFLRYYSVNTIHLVALALNPRFKSLKNESDAQRNAAYSFIREKIKQFEMQSVPAGLDEALAPAKRFRIDKDDDYQSDSDPEDDGLVEDEFSMYLKTHVRIPLEEKDSFDVLNFWKQATQYPVLRKVALWILAIPASSAADERTFSATGQIISDKRSQLSGSTVCDLTILHKNTKS